MSVAEDGKKKNLGRGLSALLGGGVDSSEDAPRGGNARTLPVELLRPGRFQPRRHFDEDAIADLVESVRGRGILQPILVRRHPDGSPTYEIIAGERRWRAAQKVGLHEVPVILKDLTDRDALEIALVENLQRQDLSPLEEADGYRRLMDEFSHTQEDLAKSLGKSRSHVANMMRLLSLPDSVKDRVERGQLSAGHARALLTADDPDALAEEVVAKGLNVRQTEKLAQDGKKAAGKGGGKSRREPEPKDADTAALERDLTNLLGVKVALTTHGKGGELVIHYGTLEQLDDILHRLSRPLDAVASE